MMESEANLNETNLTGAYRKARGDFIAACGGDSISRVHPQPGPDGKPLFCDSAAFGPRDAARAVLLIGARPYAGLIRSLPKGARLVMVHGLNPFARAFGRTGQPADWPQKTLTAIATEDLAKVETLTVLDLEGGRSEAALAAALPQAKISFRALKAGKAEAEIRAAIAAL
jgi:Protein of unknown function (DUF2817)